MSQIRRAPSGAERRRDAERTQQALLDAALTEFAAKGLAGARVQDIADRAGVNKQLISYYFGGKQGLYDAIVEHWLEQERAMADPAIDLGELTCRYLAVAHDHPDLQQLFLRENLEAELGRIAHEPDDPDLVEFRRRQEAGELAADLDPAFVLLVLQAAVSIGSLFRRDVRRYLGLDPSSEEYRDFAAEQLRRLIRHLGPPPPPQPR